MLRSRDAIVMNREDLLGSAIGHAASMADSGYRAPRRATIRLSGPAGKNALMQGIEKQRDALRLTGTDMAVAEALASVLTGSGGSATEEEVLTQERETVLALAKLPATQERIAHMLATGKPLRN